MTDYGAATIKDWLRDLLAAARSGVQFETSAGAEPGRSYAYLEYHRSDGEHSILLFCVDHAGDRPLLRAHRFDGSAAEVREHINALLPAEDRPHR